MSKNFIINPFYERSLTFFVKSKNNVVNLFFGFPLTSSGEIDVNDNLYSILFSKYKDSVLNSFSNSVSIEKRIIGGEDIYLKNKKVLIDGVEFIKEPTDGFFEFFKYDIFVDGTLVMKNQNRTEFYIPDFLLNNIGSKTITLKLFFNEVSNLINKAYFHEVSFSCNILPNIFDFSSLNAGNPCTIVANGYTLVLAPGSSIGVMVVDSIVRNSDNVKISKIMFRKTNKIDSYKALVVGSEISFINKDIVGEAILDSGIELSLFFYGFFDPNYNNNYKIGTITLSPVDDSIKFLPYKYYDCSCNSDFENLVIKTKENKLMYTSQFLKNPLFFYFVIKGELLGEINLIDNELNDVPYKIKSFDDFTHFVYFNALKDADYRFLINGHYFLKEYKNVMSSHYDSYFVNGSQEFSNIYFDKTIISHPYEDFVNVHYYLSNGSVVITNNVSTVLFSYDDYPSPGFNVTSDFYSINSKHSSIMSKVKKIEVFSLNGEPLENVSIFNFFTSYSYVNDNLYVYKEPDEIIYFAKEASEYVYNKEDIKDLVIGKRYSLENGVFSELDDGYIEFAEFSHDSYFYYDFLEEIKENSKKRIYSYVVCKKHDPNVLNFFNNNFKTPNMYLVNKAVK